jgi:hypothetical protein
VVKLPSRGRGIFSLASSGKIGGKERFFSCKERFNPNNYLALAILASPYFAIYSKKKKINFQTLKIAR